MKEKIANSFGRHASSYNENAVLQEKIAAHLANLLPASAQNILEIGCGTGFLTRHLFQKYPEANFTITDIAPEMLAICKAKSPTAKNVRYEIMDGENPAIEKSYDLIVTSMTAQWFLDPHKTMSKLQKLLTPEGSLYFAAMGHHSFPEWHNVSRETNIPNGFLKPLEWPGIMDEVYMPEQYSGGLSFLSHVKSIGAGQPMPGHKPLSPGQLRKLVRAVDARHHGQVTWHIVYGKLPAD